MTALLLAAAIGVCVQTPEPDFSRATRQAIRDSLFIAGLREEDLRTEGRLEKGNPVAVAFHRDPLAASAKYIGGAGGWDPAKIDLIAVLRAEVFRDPAPPEGSRSAVMLSIPEELPSPVRSLVQRLGRMVHEANEEVKQAISGLNSEERREVIEGLPVYAVHPSLINFEFVKRPMPSWGRLKSLLDKVDQRRIRYAAERLSTQIEACLGDIDAVRSSAPFTGRFKFFTEGLTIVVAGVGNDDHDDRDAQLTIDFGGNDRYSGRHGAGIGYAAVQIDMDGSDTYIVPDISLGAGVLGIGMAWDFGGSDLVQSDSLCLGAGVGGVGTFRSGGYSKRHGFGPLSPDGDDAYRSETMSQGFGMFGVGIFRRQGTHDDYRARYLAQGAALDGGVGWFSDNSGEKTVVASGLAPALESDRIRRSRSQGFGGRVGPDEDEPGGIGILWNKGASNSSFRAGTEAQGGGLNGGVGMLWNGEPNASFRMEGNGQGHGSNRGVGAAFSISPGEFLCRGGAAQGFGVESGIGVFLGSAGDDLYALAAGPSGSGVEGGVGIFLDEAGTDRYLIGASAGSLMPEFRGWGLFVDAGGSGVTTTPAGGSKSDFSNPWRVATFLDLEGSESVETTISEAGPPRLLRTALEIETAIGEASGIAEYPALKDRLTARKSLELALPGVLSWLDQVKRPLRRAEFRLLGALFASSASDRKKELAGRVASPDVRLAERTIEVVREGLVKEATVAVSAALGKPETRAAAARAVSALGLKEATNDLMILCASEDPKTRRAAAWALAKLGGPEALATAQVLLSNIDPVVRMAAVELYGRVGAESLGTLVQLATGGDETTARAALQALGKVGSGEALNQIGLRLSDTRPGVRIEALKQLHGRCPLAYRLQVDGCRSDPDLRVRMTAVSVDPGR